MGKGAFDGTDELYMGMLGMHGTKASNLGVTKCDLLITVGSRFSDRVIGNASRFAKNAKILQIDVDPAEINKNIQVDCSIIGDLKEVLTRLNQRIEKHEHKEWIKEIETISEEHPLKYNEEGLTGPYVIEQIYKVTEGNAIITTMSDSIRCGLHSIIVTKIRVPSCHPADLAPWVMVSVLQSEPKWADRIKWY